MCNHLEQIKLNLYFISYTKKKIQKHQNSNVRKESKNVMQEGVGGVCWRGKPF